LGLEPAPGAPDTNQSPSTAAFKRPSTSSQRCEIEYVSSVQDDNFPALSYAYSAHRRDGDRVGRVSYTCRLGVRRIRIEADALDELERRLGAKGLLPSGPA